MNSNKQFIPTPQNTTWKPDSQLITLLRPRVEDSNHSTQGEGEHHPLDQKRTKEIHPRRVAASPPIRGSKEEEHKWVPDETSKYFLPESESEALLLGEEDGGASISLVGLFPLTEWCACEHAI